MVRLPRFKSPEKPKPPVTEIGAFQSAAPTTNPILLRGDIIDSYYAPPEAPEEARAQVFIVEKDNFGNYFVKYPELAPEQADAFRVLKENLEYYFPSVETFASTEQMITQYLWETAEQAGILGIVQSASEKLRYYLLRDALGFGELDALFNDDDLEEISCTNWAKPVRIYHRRYTQHRFMETNISFPSEEALQRFVRRMAQLAGKSVSRAQPYVEGMLTHGAVEKRITATLANEVSRPGSTFVVRKQKENPLTVTQLSSAEPAKPYTTRIQPLILGPLAYSEEHYHKTVTALMIAYFWSLMEWKTNILICGEPSSGKTTLLNSLLALTNPNAKVVTCEDSPEVLLEGLHWERLVTRHAQAGLSPAAQRYEVDLAALLKLSLRFSPTILSLGEMRGEESESVANAMTIGYSTICTVHAASARDCITRITSQPMRFTMGHVRDISAIVTMRRIKLPDGREVRRVASVDEVVPNELDHSAYEVRNVFEYHPEGDSFTPTSPEEVLERSYRLRKAGEYFGWSNEHMLASLSGRAGYLTNAVREGVFTIGELSERVRAYYAKEFLKELQKEAR